jgi:hypothetical protein
MMEITELKTQQTTTDELAALRSELTQLNAHRFIRIHNSLPKLLAFQFAKGLALGLGTVVGATILVWILTLFLSTIDFIPILGDWAGEIARQIDLAQ